MRSVRLVMVLCILSLLPVVVLAEPTMTAHHTFTIVTTSAITLRAALTARRYLGLINDGAATVYCTVDDTVAIANAGIRLAASGTTGDRVFFNRNVPSGAISCISGSGTNRILVIEGR